MDKYLLECVFEDGTIKIADISPYLDTEVFKPLLEIALFKQLKNHRGYLSWLNEEVDLSADTLWHIGREQKDTALFS